MNFLHQCEDSECLIYFFHSHCSGGCVERSLISLLCHLAAGSSSPHLSQQSKKRNKTWKSRLCCIIMHAFGSTSALTAWRSIARVKCTLGHSQYIVNICTHDISRYTSAGCLVDSTFHPSSSQKSGTNSTHLAAGSAPLNLNGFISISG